MDRIKLTKAKYDTNYQLDLVFNTNEKMTVNLERFLDKNEFLALQDKDIFKQFRIYDGNLEWDNGAEFSADFLYNLPNEAGLSCV